ncbi:hypothetical protein HEP86_00160 [Streptomyces sp. RPA4-5]|uniref:hypothetical protein n=1 Tax=Streptomyces sp. RPA4-5 TaxID=2721245 RepID=UPI00143E5F21|nr:hypothetical protein [Streptomyces sp. RPA4-5]QIY53216.1 hypothetical protein HEP86_00160 [Streptomyces sp. RPA4-5]
MEAEVIAALVGVPTSVIVAAIAYPVGRGVARRQAADAHEQWLRAERRTAAQAVADAATECIETLVLVREQVERPDYAHTRRRDITSRKRLDPALYEPPKNALRAMHAALATVALHGPSNVTEAGEDLYTTALKAVHDLLYLDAAIVERAVTKAQVGLDRTSQHRTEAALEDLDTAYIRLAAPLGLPNFTTDVADTLERAAVISAVHRFTEANSDLTVPRSVVLDLLQELEDLTPEDPDLLDVTEAMRAFRPVIELLAATSDPAYQQAHPDEVLRSLQAALPEMGRILAQAGELWTGMSTDQELLDDPDFRNYYERITAHAPDTEPITQLMEQATQYLATGNDLAAAAAAGQVDPFAAITVWGAGFPALTQAVNAHLPQMQGQLNQINAIIVDVLTQRIDTARTDVGDSQAAFMEARVAFLDAARDAIGAEDKND